MPSADPPADSSRADHPPASDSCSSDSASSDSASSDSPPGDATSRRRLLGVAGAALSAGLAGCAGGVRAPASADDGPACSRSSANHSAPAFPDGWPLYGYDSRNTGSTPNASGPVDGAEIDWVEAGSGAIWGTPIVADDGVYVQPSPTRLVAFSRERGERRWSVPLGTTDESKSTRSHSGPHLTPAVVDDAVYVVGGNVVVEEDGEMGVTRVANHVNLYAVDRRSGEIRWTVGADDYVGTAPVVAGDTVLFATLGGTVYAVDAQRESVAWTLAIEGFEPPVATPAVDDCRLYLPTVESGLYAVDVERGELDWHLPELRSFAPPAVADGLVYVGGSDGTVYAVDPESASQGESGSESVAWEYDAGRAISTASPAVASGTVFVGDADGDPGDERARVQALDAGTGEEVWTAETREYVNSSPAVADGVLYAAAEGTVYGFDAASGTELWRYELPVGIRTPLSVADGRLYAATLGGDLYAFAEEA